MYGIGEHNTSSLASWRLLFLVCGIFTSLCGVAFYFIMPDGPDTAWFLTAEEKVAARHRLRDDHDGGDKTSFSTEQLYEAAVDFKTYAAFAFGILVTAPSPVLTVSEKVSDNGIELTHLLVCVLDHQTTRLYLWRYPTPCISVWSSSTCSHLDRRHRMPHLAPETITHHHLSHCHTIDRLHHAVSTTSTRMAYHHWSLARKLHLEYLFAHHEFECV